MQDHYLNHFEMTALPPQLPAFNETKTLESRIAKVRNLILSLEGAIEELQFINIPSIDEDFDFYREVERYETNLIQNALRVSNGCQARAARLLKLKPTTLNAKMKALKLLPR